MKNMIQRKNKKGFTLVELVIVIAVLAILAAVAVPTVTNVINDANKSTDKANAQTVELALKSGYAEAVSGTWKVDGEDPDEITVAQVLNHAGLGDELPKLKTSGYSWEYTSDSKITVDSSGTNPQGFSETTTLGYIF
jgi:prepilin-type N-terminal cleavage/methylation domain